MTGAHNEKVIEQALDFACEYLEWRGTRIDDDGPEVAKEDIKAFFIDYAYKKLGYIKDPLGRWGKL